MGIAEDLILGSFAPETPGVPFSPLQRKEEEEVGREELFQKIMDSSGASPTDLKKLIHFESSGGNPLARNPKTGARGLIQFLHSTAKDMDYENADDLVRKHPTFESQLSGPVKQYLDEKAKRYGALDTPRKLYLAVFYPEGINKPDSWVLPEEVQRKNPGIRTIGDYSRLLEKNVGGIQDLSLSAKAKAPEGFEGAGKANWLDYQLFNELQAGEPTPKEEAPTTPPPEPGRADIALPKPEDLFKGRPGVPADVTTPGAGRTEQEIARLPQEQQIREGLDLPKVAGKEFMKSHAELGKFGFDVFAGLPQGSAFFYDAVGLIPGKAGEWGRQMAESSRNLADAIRAKGEEPVNFWELSPEQGEALRRGGVPAATVVGVAQLAALLPQLIATGGEAQAAKLLTTFTKSYGPGATAMLRSQLNPKTVRHLGNVIGFGELEAAKAEAREGPAGIPGGAVSGMGMALAFGGAGELAGRATRAASPLVTNIAKRSAQAAVGAGLPAAQGAELQDVIAGALLGGALPVGKKEHFRKEPTYAKEVRGDERQVQKRGAVAEERQGEGGPDIQRIEEAWRAEAQPEPQAEGERPSGEVRPAEYTPEEIREARVRQFRALQRLGFVQPTPPIARPANVVPFRRPGEPVPPAETRPEAREGFEPLKEGEYPEPTAEDLFGPEPEVAESPVARFKESLPDDVFIIPGEKRTTPMQRFFARMFGDEATANDMVDPRSPNSPDTYKGATKEAQRLITEGRVEAIPPEERMRLTDPYEISREELSETDYAPDVKERLLREHDENTKSIDEFQTEQKQERKVDDKKRESLIRDLRRSFNMGYGELNSQFFTTAKKKRLENFAEAVNTDPDLYNQYVDAGLIPGNYHPETGMGAIESTRLGESYYRNMYLVSIDDVVGWMNMVTEKKYRHRKPEELFGQEQGAQGETKEPKFTEETGTMEGFEDRRKPWEIEQARREAERKAKRREQPLEGTMFDESEMEARRTQQEDLFGEGGTGAAASVGRYADVPPKEPGRPAEEPRTPEADEVLPIEFPELVELAKYYSGVVPSIKEKLRAAQGKATGQAIGKYIRLVADLAKDPVQAARTLAHEIGHVLSTMPEALKNEYIKRGNILGHMATLEKNFQRFIAAFPGGKGPLTEKELADLKQKAKEWGTQEREEVVDEVIRKETPYTPQEIKDVWNKYEQSDIDPELLEYIKILSDAEKKRIVVNAMKGIVEPTLPKKVTEEVVGKKTVKTKIQDKKAIADKLKEMIDEEIKARRLLSEDAIRKELIDLGVYWKPFNPNLKDRYTKYRLQSSELYADAVSVLLNRPDILKQRAPEFWRGFFNYFSKKPEAMEAWENIQGRIRQGEEAIMEAREVRRLTGYRRGEEQSLREEREREKEREVKKTGFFVDVYKKLMERFAILDIAEKAAKKKGYYVSPEESAFLRAREQRYISGREHVYTEKALAAEKLAKEKGGKLTQEQIDWNDRDVRDYLGSYLELKRSAGELRERFGPGGIQGEFAEKQLAHLRKKLGEEKYKRIEEAAEEFWNVRREEVIPFLTEGHYADTFSPELIKKLQENPEYSRREIVKDFEDRYGEHVAGSILDMKYLKGSLKDIKNPFIETVIYDNALIRAKAKSDFVRSVVEFFHKYKGDSDIVKNIKVEEAKKGKFGRWVRPAQGMEQVYYLQNGKVRAFNVSKELAELFERPETDMGALMRAVRGVGDIQRQVFVKFSIPFLLRNPLRDALGSLKNIPEYSVNPLPMMRYTFKAIPEIWKYLRTGEMSPDIQQAFKEGAIPIQRSFETEAKLDRGDKLDRYRNTFVGKEKEYKNWLHKAWQGIDNVAEFVGQFEEKGRKLADWKYLKEQTALSARERAHRIRTASGTPDVFAGGTLKPVTNQIWIFSNANIQGQRAAYDAFKEDPKRFALKFALYDVAPKAFQVAAATGGVIVAGKWLQDNFGFGEEEAEWLAKAYSKVGEDDLAKYTVIPLPIENSRGQVLIMRIPADYTGQAIGASLYRAMKIQDPEYLKKLASEIMSVSPIGSASLQPTIELASGLAQYATKGNIYDPWSGRMVLPKDVEGAGAARELPLISKWAYNQIGGSIVYRWPDNYDIREKGAVEKAFGLPVAGPAAGALFKWTDRGDVEKVEKKLIPIRREAKERSLEIKDRIIDNLKEVEKLRKTDPVAAKALANKQAKELYKEAKKDLGYDQGRVQFRSRYRELAIERLPDKTTMQQIARAGTIKEREAAIDVYLDNEGLTGDERKIRKRRLMRKSRLFKELFK